MHLLSVYYQSYDTARYWTFVMRTQRKIIFIKYMFVHISAVDFHVGYSYIINVVTDGPFVLVFMHELSKPLSTHSRIIHLNATVSPDTFKM